MYAEGAVAEQAPPPRASNELCGTCGEQPSTRRICTDGVRRCTDCLADRRREQARAAHKRFETTPHRRNYRKRWDSENPDKKRDHAYRHKYGISLQEYEALLDSQGGLCAVCRQPEVQRSGSGNLLPLAADHCHTTGKVRGLLCRNCNIGIGLLNDDPDVLVAAVAYLRAAQ